MSNGFSVSFSGFVLVCFLGNCFPGKFFGWKMMTLFFLKVSSCELKYRVSLSLFHVEKCKFSSYGLKKKKKFIGKISAWKFSWEMNGVMGCVLCDRLIWYRKVKRLGNGEFFVIFFASILWPFVFHLLCYDRPLFGCWESLGKKMVSIFKKKKKKNN